MKFDRDKAEQRLKQRAHEMQNLSPADAKMLWMYTVEPELAQLTREVLREMKDEEGVRPLADALGISPSYVVKLTGDESESPPAPSVAQLDRFATLRPERFGFLRPVLEAGPFFVQRRRELGAEREAMGRRSGRPVPRSGSRLEEWQVAFGGRRREIGGILDEMAREFRRLGATGVVRWHGHAVPGVVDPGDALFIAPPGARPRVGALGLVRSAHDLYYIYGWNEDAGAWRPLDQPLRSPSVSPFPAEAEEVEVVGEIVGVLKAHRL